MDRQTRREIRRTGRAGQLAIIAIGLIVLGAPAFVMGFVQFLQVSQFLQNSAAVNGTISDKFITYHESNGDTFPDFHFQYTYVVNGNTLTQSQDVGRDLYDRSAEGQPITIYYLRDQPSTTRIDAPGSIGAPRAMVFIGLGAFLLGCLGLFVLYRIYWRS